MVKSSAASATPVKRSRGGCQTCRARKLKCDEVSPECGQCQKSNRRCVQSEGVSFRHHQNAGMKREEQQTSLNSFFKNSQTFSADNLKSFLPVPSQLSWVYVSDPTAEDETTTTPPTHSPPAANSYQQVAAHSLEALSTAAAADHVSFPPQATAYYTAVTAPTDGHPEYGFVRTGSGADGPASTAPYGVNPSSHTPSSLIDPNLESTVADAAERAVEDMSGAPADKAAEGPGRKDGASDEEGDTDTRVAMALRSFNENPV